MKKRITVLMMLALTAALAVGCRSKTDSGAGSTAADRAGSVYWLNFKPEADAALQELAASYTQRTGVRVKIVTAASDTYEQTLTAEMDKSDAPTLFVLGNGAAVRNWGRYCYDLRGTEVYNELATDDFTLYDEEGRACAIGYCYECFGIIVNTRLLAESGHSLAEIRDFASLKQVADDIHAHADALGFDAFTSAGLDDASSWRFSGHLANMPLYYESVEDNWQDCPPALTGNYLENYKQIWDLYITDSAAAPTSLATAGLDAQGEFGRGKAVFYQNGSWEYAALTGEYGMDPAELAMIPIYCGVPGEENAGLCSGTENCWAVNAHASGADIQATLDFMKWMVTSEEGTACMAEQFGEIPYRSAAENPNVFFHSADAYREAGRYTVGWVFGYTPNVSDWRAGVTAALTQYCAGGPWENVERAFVAGWAAQYAAANA